MEALGLAATSYNSLHKYFDDPKYTKSSTSTSSTSSPFEILQRIQSDKRFDSLEHGGFDTLLEEHEDLILEQWNAWHIQDPTKQFEDSQYAAAALLVATKQPFDFFLVHLLTTTHALRILLPSVPNKFHVSLVRQGGLITLRIYSSQGRPRIDVGKIESYALAGRDWAFAEGKAVSGRWSMDAHYVKAIRAMKVAAETWGDERGFYLKAATKFADEFDNWDGFYSTDGDVY